MHPNWICSLAGWLRWGSLAALLGVVASLEVAFFAPVPHPQDFRKVIWDYLLRPGFAVAVAAFLLSLACQMAGAWVGRRAGGRR